MFVHFETWCDVFVFAIQGRSFKTRFLFVKFVVFRAFFFIFNLFVDRLRLFRVEKIVFEWEGDLFWY